MKATSPLRPSKASSPSEPPHRLHHHGLAPPPPGLRGRHGQDGHSRHHYGGAAETSDTSVKNLRKSHQRRHPCKHLVHEFAGQEACKDRSVRSNRCTEGNRSSNPSGQQKRRSGTLARRFEDRDALHMRRHRKEVGLSGSRKRPGQRPFFGSLSRLREPGASNERHDVQHVPPLRDGTRCRGQLPWHGRLPWRARLWTFGPTARAPDEPEPTRRAQLLVRTWGPCVLLGLGEDPVQRGNKPRAPTVSPHGTTVRAIWRVGRPSCGGRCDSFPPCGKTRRA